MTSEEIGRCITVLKRKNARKRDKERAAKELYERFKKPLLFFIRQKLHNRSLAVDADDIVIVTFAKAFTKIKLFDEKKAAFPTWLFNIANNTFLDHVRPMMKSHFVQHADHEYVFGSGLNHTGTIFDLNLYDYNGIKDLVRKERHEEARDMVASIPNEKQREAVGLFYFGELKYKEIAKAMKMPMNTVKINIFRGNKVMEGYALAV